MLMWFWNQVYSAEYPVVRAFALAAVLHIPWRKHHQGHGFAVTFEDADEHPSARFEGQFRVGDVTQHAGRRFHRHAGGGGDKFRA